MCGCFPHLNPHFPHNSTSKHSPSFRCPPHPKRKHLLPSGKDSCKASLHPPTFPKRQSDIYPRTSCYPTRFYLNRHTEFPTRAGCARHHIFRHENASDSSSCLSDLAGRRLRHRNCLFFYVSEKPGQHTRKTCFSSCKQLKRHPIVFGKHSESR